ncbi:MAG: cytochrome c maturation protein CcmE [Alphaproteobacteria bacterium]|nr:cytochrome c maturation protein CcmE [Alphaproteobacteria bacterium]PPR13937.1 MAG: Cytochrome c-type biogenesis protein CcmE [Alphaproteobacteria bacterium MarineAlpha12_Bin1]
MKRKNQRLILLFLALVLTSSGATLILIALEDNLVYFYTPTDVKTKNSAISGNFRLGGIVLKGSIREFGTVTKFGVTDLKSTLFVRYEGVLPDLFREEQGIVAEGSLSPNGVFIATNILAKHDENYMPKEVSEALKKSGRWKDTKPKK